MIYAMIAIAVILLIVWVWVNAAFIRKQPSTAARRERTQEDSMAQNPVATGDEPVAKAEQQGPGVPDSRPKMNGTDPELQMPSAPATQGTNGVFLHRDRPYILHDVNVPEFAEPAWDSVFTSLCDDDHVLGWVAFRDDRHGAADRNYEQGLVDALRQHRNATEQLRRHVGLSQVRETSVIGDEGKVWFLTAVDHAWLALFVENETDALPLVHELLAPVQSMADSAVSDE